MDRITVLPFLVSMFIAVAGMPTDVFQVCFGEMGHEHTQPWRSRCETVVRRGRVLMARLAALVTAWRGHPLAMPAAAVVAALLLSTVSADAGALMATVGVPSAAAQMKALMAEQAENQKRVLSLNAKVVAKEALTEAEQAELASLASRGKVVTEALAVAIAANEAERNAPDPNASADPDAAVSAAARVAAGLPSVVPGKDNREDEVKSAGFFGKALTAVKDYAANGGWSAISTEQKRLIHLLGWNKGTPIEAAATGMNTDIGSEGGFAVAQERATTVRQRTYATGEILSRITPMPIGPGANGVVLPAIDETSRADGSRYGGIASGWLGQGNTLTAGKPKFRPMDLKLRKVGAFVYATDELLSDAIALEGWVDRYLPLELRFRVEDACLNGIGSNQPQGQLGSGAVLTLTRTSSGRILSEDLRAMVNRLWAPLWSSAVFLVDQSTLGEFDQLSVAVGTGGQLDPSYKPAGSVPGQKYATYKNIPIIPVEYCASLGTSGDIVLTSWDEYTLIDKGAVEQAISMHVAFLTAEQVFRFMYRVDGQCNWNAPLTPKSNGATLSCTVVLSTV